VNLAFRTETVTFSGDLNEYSSVADSGNHMHRLFCPSCGTHVFSRADERPHLVVVRAGTLDEPNAIKPQGLIWTSQAPDWARLDPSIPHFEGQPPPVA
jgi:hypothetical protein